MSEQPLEPQMPTGAWRSGWMLFLAGSLFYLLTTSGERPNGDGTLLFAVAERMVDEGTICLKGARPGNTTLLGPECSVSDYGLGTSLLLVPGVVLLRGVEALGLREGASYEVVRALVTHLVPSALGAFCWLFFFVFALRLGASRQRAFFLTLAFGLTTTIWFYQRTFLSESLQTLCLLMAVVGFHSHKRFGRRLLPLIGGAAALGGAAITKGVLWTLVPVFLLYLAWDQWKKLLLPLALVAASLAPFVALQAWHNAYRFGSVFDFGYHTFRDGELGFSHPLWDAVWGYLFSPSKSFFLFNPLALVALFGWRRFYKTHQAEAALFASIAIVVVFVFGRWWSWHGDWSWGPRFLVVLVPFLSLPAVFVLPQGLSGRRLLKSLAVLGFAAAFFVQFLGCAVPVWKYLGIAFESARPSFPGFEERLGGEPYKPLDDQLTVHYLPQFSPIRGHWWLLKHMIDRDPDLGSDYPWKSLGIDAWKPRPISLDYGPDWWGAQGGLAGPPWGLVLPIGFALLLATGFAFALAWKRVPASP